MATIDTQLTDTCLPSAPLTADEWTPVVQADHHDAPNAVWSATMLYCRRLPDYDRRHLYFSDPTSGTICP